MRILQVGGSVGLRSWFEGISCDEAVIAHVRSRADQQDLLAQIGPDDEVFERFDAASVRDGDALQVNLLRAGYVFETMFIIVLARATESGEMFGGG